MKLIFGSKNRGKLVIKLILFAMLLYAVSLFISQRMLISNKQKKISEMKQQLSFQQDKIGEIKAELKAINSSDRKYLESIAHKDLNLSKRGERVFANIKGN